MRSSISSAILPFLLPALVAATPTHTTCLHLKGDEMAETAKCGDKVMLRDCFSKGAVDGRGTVETCLKYSGCTADEAVKEATWILEYCESEPEDLKRRRPESGPAPTTTSPHASQIWNELRARETTTTSTSLQCSTASNTVVSSCVSGSISCSDVSTTVSVCQETNICLVDKQGNNLCLVRDDNLGTSGTIVSVFLGAVVAVTITTLIFLCCRDKKAQKRMRAKMEAAAIAKENAASRPRPSIPPAAAPAPGVPNPFQDVNRM